MTAPPLAILMPFKDASPFVRQAMESVLNQEFSDFRLFAIDDSSTDDTREIIESYRDPRVQVVKCAGRGIPAALNTGLGLCQDYPLAARHDADDISTPDRLAKQVERMLADPSLDVLGTQAERIDEAGAFLRPYIRTPETHDQLVNWFRYGYAVCHGSVMYRPHRVLEGGGYNLTYRWAQGMELWVRLALQGHRFAALPDMLYRIRTHDSSWSFQEPERRMQLVRTIREQAMLLPELAGAPRLEPVWP